MLADSLNSILLKWVHGLEKTGTHLVKIETAKLYVKTIESTRQVSNLIVKLLVSFVFAAIGFFTFFFLGLLNIIGEIDIATWVIVVLGIFFVLPVMAFFFLNSEKSWVKAAGVDKVLESIKSSAPPPENHPSNPMPTMDALP